jgi:hypothetical protein
MMSKALPVVAVMLLTRRLVVAEARATIEDTAALASATTSLRVSSITATTGNALDIIFSTGADGDDTQGYVFSSTVIGFFFSGTDTRLRQEYYYHASTQLAIDGTTLSD